MRIRGVTVGAILSGLVLTASGTTTPGSAAESGSPGSDAVESRTTSTVAAARAPKRFKIIQMNLCLHQNCTMDDPKPALAKRNEAAKIIKKRKPNAVTMNEMCRNDLRAIARRTHLKWRFTATEFDAGRCDHRGGKYGIALLARRFDGPRVDVWRYRDGYQRRGMCARTAGKVLICTTHLENVNGTSPPNECRKLRTMLAERRFPVVFGGDVNRRGEPHPCRRKRKMWGLSDHDSTKASAGLQHVYVTRFGYPQRSGHGRVLGMRTTDHPAFLVRMKRRR